MSEGLYKSQDYPFVESKHQMQYAQLKVYEMRDTLVHTVRLTSGFHGSDTRVIPAHTFGEQANRVSFS
jgi:hypothetical protein